MSQHSQDHFGTGLGFVLIATLGWSLSGIFVRFLPHLSGWQINCWRGYWMAAALLCYLAVKYGRHLPDKFRAIPASAFLSSTICFAVGTTAYITALTLTTTATVSVIGSTSPLVTGLLSPWITREKPSVVIWLAAVFAALGAAYIGFNAISVADSEKSNHVLGVLVSLGVPITFAVQTLLLRRHRAIDLMPAICVGGFLAFLGCGSLGFLLAGTSGFTIELKSLGVLMLMGPLQLAIPLIFYGMGARYVTAASLSVLSMFDAVLNPLWPYLFVGEIPSRYTVIGGSVILGAVLMSIFGARFYENARRLSTR
jgi:drug/metabolite transporter, DME family